MMKKGKFKSALLTLLIIFTSFLKGYSIGNDTQVGAREVSMGNASVALISPFSVFHNQAALAWLNGTSLAVDYRQPFLIDGLSQKALALVVPTPLSNFALALQQKGIQEYHESRFGFAMARKFGDQFSAGLQFDYFMIEFPEQGRSKGTFFMELGLMYQTKHNVTIGLHLFNPSGASIESINYVSELPVTATCGIALKPLENLLFTGTLDYYSDKPLVIRMGIEYQCSDRFFLRFGLSGKPIQHSAGLGYKWNIFTIDFALMHHESLGYTPSFSLTLNI